jgi:hypothetical protein
MAKFARRLPAPEIPIQRSTLRTPPAQQPTPARINMTALTPETILQLHGVIGNQTMQRLLAQRDTTAAEKDDETKAAKQEWDAHKGIHVHFDNKFQKYLDIRPAYLAAGITDPAQYIVDNIVTVTFFGHKSPAHKDLQAPLQQAEAALKAQKFDAKLIYSFWSFVPRAIRNSTKLSEHARGRAIDINPDKNPRITKADDFCVIAAVTGVHLGKEQTAETMRKANDTFKATFKQSWVDDKQRQLDQLLKDDKPTPDTRKKIAELKKVLDAVKRRRTELNGYAATGFLNLDQALVDALIAAKFKWGGDFKSSKDFMHFEFP